jgi:hypothetical protein
VAGSIGGLTAEKTRREKMRLTIKTELRYNGEPAANGVTKHRVTSPAGVARILARSANGNGWSTNVVVSRAALAALGGYEGKYGDAIIPLPAAPFCTREPLVCFLD